MSKTFDSQCLHVFMAFKRSEIQISTRWPPGLAEIFMHCVTPFGWLLA